MRLRDRDEASKNQQISETCTGSEKPNYTKLTDNVMFAYTVIRCTRHLIHSTRSAGTNHILVPSRVVVHNFGGFYHQSFLPAEAQNIGLYSKEMLQQLHETLEKTLEKKIVAVSSLLV